jgi:flap endonuclease-1
MAPHWISLTRCPTRNPFPMVTLFYRNPICFLPRFLAGTSSKLIMGILGLSKLIADVAPSAIKENEIKNYFGRKVAIDASMSLYQFLIAVRSEGAQLTNAEGETTSHLMGTFYRTIRMVDNGIKPVYVFDGKPPVLKGGELEKRNERRAEAEAALQKAKEEANVEEIDKQNRRLVKVGKEHVQDCKELLKLMGIPYVEAPCEVSRRRCHC